MALGAMDLLALVHHVVRSDATILRLDESASTPTQTGDFCAANKGGFAVCHGKVIILRDDYISGHMEYAKALLAGYRCANARFYSLGSICRRSSHSPVQLFWTLPLNLANAFAFATVSSAGHEYMQACFAHFSLTGPDKDRALQDRSLSETHTARCGIRGTGVELEAEDSLQQARRLGVREPTQARHAAVLAWLAVSSAPTTCSPRSRNQRQGGLAHSAAHLRNTHEGKRRRHQDDPGTATSRQLPGNRRRLHTGDDRGEAGSAGKSRHNDTAGKGRPEGRLSAAFLPYRTLSNPRVKGSVSLPISLIFVRAVVMRRSRLVKSGLHLENADTESESVRTA